MIEVDPDGYYVASKELEKAQARPVELKRFAEQGLEKSRAAYLQESDQDSKRELVGAMYECFKDLKQYRAGIRYFEEMLKKEKDPLVKQEIRGQIDLLNIFVN